MYSLKPLWELQKSILLSIQFPDLYVLPSIAS